ncbi:hypothetical protein DFQ26_002763 [Actinomortierella ambigua]|nr:hypothetical protein DFQ26_002763 [Actinomortierella ambigua]
MTARGKPRSPQLVSDEIPDSLDGVIWAAQLVALKDMDQIRRGFSDTPGLLADPTQEDGGRDQSHLYHRRHWVSSNDRRDDSDSDNLDDTDGVIEQEGVRKLRVWNNKGANRLVEENVPFWNLPVKSECVQSTCQLDANINPNDNKFFAFMDPETFEIHLPKNWPSLCMSCIELSRSQFVYRTRVRLWGDLWPCLDHPIPSQARGQITFPTGIGSTTIATATSSASATATSSPENEAAAAAAVAPHNHLALKNDILHIPDKQRSHPFDGNPKNIPHLRQKGTTTTTVPAAAAASAMHPPAAAALEQAPKPRPAHRRRADAAVAAGHKQTPSSTWMEPTTTPAPKRTNPPRQRQQQQQQQQQRQQQKQQGQRRPPRLPTKGGQKLSESYLNDEDLSTLPLLIVDPATFENLTRYESPLSLLRSNRFTAEFRFVVC